MVEGASPSHTFLFTVVYCMYYILTVLVLISVFDLSPPCSTGMVEKEQTYNIGSSDLCEDALDNMMHCLCLQSDDQGYLDQEVNRESEHEQLCRRVDNFINTMSPGSGRRVDLDPIPDVFNYITSTPVGQLRQQPSRPPMVDEYNYVNLQNIKAPVPPKGKDNENILED